MDEQVWEDAVDINLTGVEDREGGGEADDGAATGAAVIITSSVAGLFGFPNLAHYIAAKHGVVGLMRTSPRSWRLT
jgi:NAD(P)-dependent dehydrogenase (short-subunit alcohol dehydrogenase family)